MKVIRALKSISIFCFFSLIFLEIGVRLINWAIFENNREQFTQYSQIFTDERHQDYLFWHKKNINVKLTSRESSFQFQTNSLGHRSTNDIINFDQSIVFLGDSIVEGSGVEGWETIPHIVGSLLNIGSVNLGAGSSNTVQEYYLLKAKYLDSFNGKLVVLGFCWNDLEQNTYRRAFNPEIGNWEFFDNVVIDFGSNTHKFSSSIVTIDNESMLLKIKRRAVESEAIMFIYRIYRLLGGSRISESLPETSFISERNFNYTEYFIKRIRDLVLEKNMRFMVVIFPTRDQVEGIADFDQTQKLKAILEKNLIPYFDPASDLVKSHKLGISLFNDAIHPNAHGSVVIANGLAEFVDSQEFLD